MMGLTSRQRDMLAVIRAAIEETGVAPSYDDLGARLGMCKSSVHRLVHGLVDRGAIRLLRHRARAIALVEERFERPIEAGLTFVCASTGRSREQLVEQAVAEFLDRQVRS